MSDQQFIMLRGRRFRVDEQTRRLVRDDDYQAAASMRHRSGRKETLSQAAKKFIRRKK